MPVRIHFLVIDRHDASHCISQCLALANSSTALDSVVASNSAMTREPISRKLKSRGLKPTGVRSDGAGLTKIEHEKFDFFDLVTLLQGSASDQALAKEAFPETFPVPLEEVARACESAKEVLRQANFPSNNKLVEVHPDGSWTPLADDSLLPELPPPSGRLMSGLAYSAAAASVESNLWFAAKLLDRIDGLVSAINACDATRAASNGLVIGRLLERYWWKFHHEKAAFDGYAADKSRRKGYLHGTMAQERRGRRHYAAIVSEARRLWAANPSLARNYSETAKLIEERALPALRQRAGNFLRREAIRKHINNAVTRGDLGNA